MHEVVFPAHAGMTRRWIARRVPPFSVPRPRGDDPTHLCTTILEFSCSPPTRG